jgi:hypothetical protein
LNEFPNTSNQVFLKMLASINRKTGKYPSA